VGTRLRRVLLHWQAPQPCRSRLPGNHLPLQRLTPAQLTTFYRFLLDHGRRGGGHLAARTVRNIHGELHAARRDAVRWGHIVHNVAASADLLKGMAPEMHIWSPEQLRA
jgi:hypothetical protein